MRGSYLLVAISAAYFLFSLMAGAETSLDERFFTSDDQTFKEAILKNSMALEDWVASINSEADQLLCLGETHRDAFREFVGEKLLPHLNVERLFLEVTQEQVGGFEKQFLAGETEITMLGASVFPVLQSAWKRERPVQVFGIEETKEQGKASRLANSELGREFYSRDGFIAQNVLAHLKPKGLQVALYGALHCTKFDLGLGGKLPFMNQLAPELKKMNLPGKNVLLLRHDDGGMLDLYLQMMGLGGKTFVIADTSKIKPSDYNKKWQLYETFSNYDTVIYFGEEKSSSSSRR